MKLGTSLSALAIAAVSSAAFADNIYRMDNLHTSNTNRAAVGSNSHDRVAVNHNAPASRQVYVPTGPGHRSFYITPTFSWNAIDSDSGLDDSPGFGLKAGIDMSRNWSVELSLDYTETDEAREAARNNEVALFALSFDGVRRFNNIGDGRVTPYVLGGLGFVKSGTFINEYDGLAVSLGGGILADVPNWPAQLRAELKTRYVDSDSISEDDSYLDWVLSLGVQFDVDFSEREPDQTLRYPIAVASPVKEIGRDSDGDTVPDQRDRCPNTSPGITVNPRGCEVDTDADGVVDSKDKCLDTEIGVVVGKVGCALFLDVDDDGILNEDDKCPNTEKGAFVDATGCKGSAPAMAAEPAMTAPMMKSEEPMVMSPTVDSSLPIAATYPMPGDAPMRSSADVITLNGVEFEYKSTRLTERAKRSLSQYVQRFEDNRDMVAEVAGHTDSKASRSYNQRLSEQRADSVRRYLVKSGVRPSQLSTRGYGEDEPVASNSTEDGRARNRRVELRILSQ